ncbi:MAG: glutamate synthase subunit beta [Sandaracinaceae bacterium]|nr:glutamate synthase subunit beta [Sandaracinaceae bacterium]
MGDPTGFLRIERALPPRQPVKVRLRTYEELETRMTVAEARDQGARCMACGVPFCHAGCPLGNLIPDFNHLVYEDRWREAIEVLHATNNFPEFTGRVCPAPCEASCVLNIERVPVTIERIEEEIADRAWDEGWVRAQPAATSTGKRVAIAGSGPAGLAAAQELARLGHAVTVLERDDRIGGLLRYGIPDFKLDKRLLDRRLAQLTAEGVTFRTGVTVGDGDDGGVSVASLRAEHDAVIIAVGATLARELPIEGRELDGVHLAMDFLVPQNKRVAGDTVEGPSAAGKRVVILGGGDTGSDCLGTSLRQGALSVKQIELMPQPPDDDPLAWPDWPMILRTSSSQEEGGERDFAVMTKRFLGKDGKLTGLEAVRVERVDGKLREIEGSTFTIDADLCLLALGFVGSTVAASGDGVFTCGDARRGQSLVVWAIAEGRECARDVHAYLTPS